ncbi:MAG: flavin reductase [Treponema sp.]|nr:flavin reductase [Treponema sp.]
MKQKEAVPSGTEWIKKNIREFPGSPIERIGTGWMLITAAGIDGDRSNWNTMTASWGGLGVLWQKDVAFMVVRPSRHTYSFVNDASLFTLSFFDEKYRTALNICGDKSGRDIDKAAATGLTPVFFRGPGIEGAVSFKEAKDILICKKLYTHDFDPSRFLDRESIEECYHGKDYHRMFIGEIVEYRGK